MRHMFYSLNENDGSTIKIQSSETSLRFIIFKLTKLNFAQSSISFNVEKRID